MSWQYEPAACAANSTQPSCQPAVLAFFALLLEYLGGSYDEKLAAPRPSESEFDFVVVGAGSAGSVVASRLSEVADWKILLLEAGDEAPAITNVPGLSSLALASELNYAYRSRPQALRCGASEARSFALSAGRVLGGTSAINGMWYIRGNRRDYDDWGGEWSWDKVLPYFRKSEDMRDEAILRASPHHHGTGGPLTVDRTLYKDESADVLLDGWKELGFEEVDYNAGDQLGTSKMQYTVVHGARQSAYGAFLRPVRAKRPNLVIRPNSKVTRVVIDPRSRRAVGVEYVDLKSNDTVVVKARKEVVVSAGSIISPKLLMLSGVGPADDLREMNIPLVQDSPVGRTLYDHVNVAVVQFRVQNKSLPSTLGGDMQSDLVQWLDTHEGPLAAPIGANSITFLRTSQADRPGPDLQVAFFTSSNDSSIPFRYYDRLTASITLLTPTGSGELRLNGSDPVEGDPIVSTNYVTPRDTKILAEGIRIVRRLANTESFQRHGYVLQETPISACRDFERDSDEYLGCAVRCRATAADHSIATCRMGAVVDQRLRVRGVRGLRVADASVMPRLPRASLNAPTVMIGERAADFVKREWLG